MLFNWLRTRIKAAVLCGINDALDEVRQGDTTQAEPSPLRLGGTDTPAPALPAPALPAPAEPVRKNGRKATPLTGGSS
jgi:hypothetical protein